jgi:hypothetical protein
MVYVIDAAAAVIPAAGAVVPSFSAYPLASVTAVGKLLLVCCAVAAEIGKPLGRLHLAAHTRAAAMLHSGQAVRLLISCCAHVGCRRAVLHAVLCSVLSQHIYSSYR